MCLDGLFGFSDGVFGNCKVRLCLCLKGVLGLDG